MERKKRLTSPTYQKIAVDIASRIVEKEYEIGEKLYTRSSLASQYNVSAETARRAISILTDLDIVKTIKGSGVIITSYENAIKFVQQFSDKQTVNNIAVEIRKSLEKQKNEADIVQENIMKLLDYTKRFQSLNPFVPFELEITDKTPFLNKNVSEVNFWHNTGATIIAIQRKDSMLLSPGPYAMFKEGDIYFFIGTQDSYRRVINFLYPENQQNN